MFQMKDPSGALNSLSRMIHILIIKQKLENKGEHRRMLNTKGRMSKGIVKQFKQTNISKFCIHHLQECPGVEETSIKTLNYFKPIIMGNSHTVSHAKNIV